MQTIKQTLNRIKWDKSENPDLYTIGYEDRKSKELVEIPYNQIVRIDEGFMIIDDGEEVSIPLHRIRHLKKQKEIVWQRPPKR